MIVRGYVEVICGCGYTGQFRKWSNLQCPKCGNTSGLKIKSLDGKPLKHQSEIHPKVFKGGVIK